MVLEDATSPTPNEGFDNDNADPSAESRRPPTNSPSTSQIFTSNGMAVDLTHIDFDRLPKPWFAFLGTSTQLKRDIPPLVASLQKGLPRPMTTTETQAIVEHMSNALAVRENWQDIGLFTAFTMWARRTKVPELGLGTFARKLPWSIPWAIGGMVAGKIMGSLIVPPITTMRILNDKRLETFNADLQSSLRQQQLEGGQRETRKDRWQRPPRPSRVEIQGQDEDDASPAASPHPEYNPIPSNTTASATTQPARTDSWASSRPQQQQTEELFDDASPAYQPPPREDASPSESAWDRIRRNANEPSASRQARGSASRSGEDSFSFSTADEERELAKAEAQKLFDARVEQERQGKDFNDGGKRW